MKRSIIALSLAALGTAVLAQDSGWYLGTGIGLSSVRSRLVDFDADMPGISESRDRDDMAWKLFAGYRLGPYWGGAEGGYYADPGWPNYSYPSLNTENRPEETALYVAGTGIFPSRRQFSVFGKLGVAGSRARTPLGGDILGLSGTDINTRTDLIAGFGAEYVPAANVGIRLEYENYGRMGDSDAFGRIRDLWSAGISLRY